MGSKKWLEFYVAFLLFMKYVFLTRPELDSIARHQLRETLSLKILILRIVVFLYVCRVKIDLLQEFQENGEI